jgi:hypothetical protein
MQSKPAMVVGIQSEPLSRSDEWWIICKVADKE